MIRRLAEDRKNYFDTMERHMFSSKQSTKGTGRESVRTGWREMTDLIQTFADSDQRPHEERKCG